MKTFTTCALAALLILGLVACSDDDGGDDSMLPPGPTSCTLPAPTNASPQVTATGCDSVNCSASFTVQSPVSLGRVQWSFPGGAPSESGNVTGVVSYPRPATFPASRSWTVTLCACRPEVDINGASCRGTNGIVTWSSGALASTSD